MTETHDQIGNLLAWFAEPSSEELEIGPAQGLYGEQRRPPVEVGPIIWQVIIGP